MKTAYNLRNSNIPMLKGESSKQKLEAIHEFEEANKIDPKAEDDI